MGFPHSDMKRNLIFLLCPMLIRTKCTDLNGMCILSRDVQSACLGCPDAWRCLMSLKKRRQFTEVVKMWFKDLEVPSHPEPTETKSRWTSLGELDYSSELLFLEDFNVGDLISSRFGHTNSRQTCWGSEDESRDRRGGMVMVHMC